MRILIFLLALLVLLNVTILFWPDNASSAPHIYTSKAEINPHFIRLNKEIEDKYLDALPATGGDPEFRLVAANGANCYRLGPFMHRSNYELAQAVLFNAEVEYQKSTREAKQSSVYRVYLGPFESQSLALDKRTELRSINILDHFVRKVDEENYIVSLGIYTTAESANSAVELFDGKLDSVKMGQEDLVLPNSFWLHFAIQEGDQLQQQLGLMDWGEQSAKLGRYQCKEA